MKSYILYVNFCGFIGADNDYRVFADSYDEAVEDALELAAEDLTVEEIEQIDDGEYEVTIGFATFIGVEESYTVFADSEDEAEEAALEEAKMDLEVVESYDDEEY